MEPTTVKLRNGREVAKPVMQTTLLTARRLAENPATYLAFFDLVSMSKDPSYLPFGGNGEMLERFSLMDGGRLHRDVAAVIDAAYGLDATGINITPRDPLADSGEEGDRG